MLSIDMIRNDPERVRLALESKGEAESLSGILELDAQRRMAITEGDGLRSDRNRVNRELGHARSSGTKV